MRIAIRNPGRAGRVGFLALGAVMLAPAAQAYVGPGAGLTALGTVVALILALALAVVGFVWYPLKRVLKRRRDTPSDPAPDTAMKAPAGKPR